MVEIFCALWYRAFSQTWRRNSTFHSSPDFQGTENTTSGLTAIRTQPIPNWMRSFFGVLSTTTLKCLRYRIPSGTARFRRRGVETKDHFKVPSPGTENGLLWATGFVAAENGGAPEIFESSWGLDRQ